ncbi:hypothetical protein FRC07_005776 [Ceratobasidium sp. 392]|nr:hypothetical protein FRC07_005776 [Ceratobasidium sp. 392]
MTQDFWNSTENCSARERAKRAHKALDFIVSHGGATSRWRSVAITTKTFYSHHVVVDFLRSSPLPELQFLVLRFHGPNDDDEEDEAALFSAIDAQPLSLFRHPPSKLHMMKLEGLPVPLLLEHPNQLPSLTHLDLWCVCSVPRLSDLYALLRTTTELAVLHLDLELLDPAGAYEPDPSVSKIRLPRLKELALYSIKEVRWLLDTLMMLEAPKIEFLRISRIQCEASIEELVHYLVDGGDKLAPKPVFPTVTHLWVCFAGLSDPTSLLKVLLSAYPQITRLVIPCIPLDALLVKPWLVPNLQQLESVGRLGSEYKKVVAARTLANLPLRVVVADIRYGHLIMLSDRKYISKKVEFRFLDGSGTSQLVNDVPSEEELRCQVMLDED